MNNSEGIGKNLIATLSHQLKSPISTIQSLLKTVSDGFTGETNAHTLQFIEKATRKAREANELISDLLNYEAYAGAGKIDKKELDFVDLVRTAAAGLGAEASGRDVSVRLRLPEKTSVIVFGNARGLDIAVSNLMENAIKYTPAGGVVLVKISVTKRNKRCLLQVVDSGYGIAAEEMKNIFTPFYRSVKHKAVVSGTGLGLAITRNIANIHYGDLSVSSREGEGSTFTLALPFLRDRKSVV
jgi:signal transduction histidine kinase